MGEAQSLLQDPHSVPSSSGAENPRLGTCPCAVRTMKFENLPYGQIS